MQFRENPMLYLMGISSEKLTTVNLGRLKKCIGFGLDFQTYFPPTVGNTSRARSKMVLGSWTRAQLSNFTGPLDAENPNFARLEWGDSMPRPLQK